MFSWRYMHLTTPTHVREQKALNITNFQCCLLQKFQVLCTSACWVGWHVLPPHTFKLCSQYDTKACMFCCFTLSLHLNHVSLWPDAKLLLWGLDPSFPCKATSANVYGTLKYCFTLSETVWVGYARKLTSLVSFPWCDLSNMQLHACWGDKQLEIP